MRIWLSTNQKVAQYWAKQKQPEGKGSNFFFEEKKLFSWGHHFCVARHIDDEVVAFTTQRAYSQSTRQHCDYALSALPKSKKIVYAHNPDAAVWVNRDAALKNIKEALDDAALPRIRRPRRDRSNAHAEHLARQFNEYLAALPDSERSVPPFPDTAQGLREHFIVQHVIARLEK